MYVEFHCTYMYTTHLNIFNILLCWSCQQYTDLLSHTRELQTHLCQSLLPENVIIIYYKLTKQVKYQYTMYSLCVEGVLRLMQ